MRFRWRRSSNSLAHTSALSKSVLVNAFVWNSAFPDELMKTLVPALILQPLVENSIRHGIEPRRGPGFISIEAKAEDKHLHLIVRDDGRGLPGTNSNRSSRRGIGLANTQARLQALYGQDQSFFFGSAEPHGCQVDIRLPLHLEPVLKLNEDGLTNAVSNAPAA